MRNHKTVENKRHFRPCFYTFKDTSNSSIYWMIPISSKYERYKKIHDAKKAKYKNYNQIVLGYVLGRKCAFLVQNMCPVIEKYIDSQYILEGKDVTINSAAIRKKLYHAAKDTLYLYEEKNIKVIFPDVKNIKVKLLQQLELSKRQEQSTNEKAKQKVINQQTELKNTANSNTSNKEINETSKSKELNADNKLSAKTVNPKKIKSRFSLKYCQALGEKVPEKEPAIKRKPGMHPQRQFNNEKFVQLAPIKPKKKRFNSISPNKDNDRNRTR